MPRSGGASARCWRIGGARKKILIPDSAHGTNPATAAIAGYAVENIRSNAKGLLDLEALAGAVNENTAAVILEVVQGEGGVTPGQAEYLRGAEALCHEKGALLILDEVQTGFGRTGKWFAFEHFHVEPEIITAAKGLASGMPHSG